MPTFPPLPNIVVRDLETLMDAFAYLLQTDPRTDNINWILGDPGMGKPGALPFGYISILSEGVTWYTSQGGVGGLAAGLDDWQIPIVLTIAHEPHRFVNPGPATPGSGETPQNPFSLANLGSQVPYLEQPGWRASLQITQDVKKVMRTNHNVGGAATDTHVVESRFVIMEIGEALHRVTRITIQTQQRRVRGN